MSRATLEIPKKVSSKFPPWKSVPWVSYIRMADSFPFHIIPIEAAIQSLWLYININFTFLTSKKILPDRSVGSFYELNIHISMFSFNL